VPWRRLRGIQEFGAILIQPAPENELGAGWSQGHATLQGASNDSKFWLTSSNRQFHTDIFVSCTHTLAMFHWFLGVSSYCKGLSF
jgi:hypothetical protein